MRVIRDTGTGVLPLNSFALAVGNFDGLHLGHQAVLRAVLAYKNTCDVPAVVMTFSPHPRRFFNPDLPVLSIEPMHRRLRRLKAMGFDAVIVRHFDAACSRIVAQDFIAQDIIKRMQVRYLATGDNFVFGYKRGGNRSTLQEAAQRYNFVYEPVMMHAQHDMHYSSSKIRDFLSKGDVGSAAQMLGRDYEITGIVQHGEKRGRLIGFPTANIALPRIFAPALGVYAVRFVVGKSEIYDKPDAALKWMDGVANIGMRPTFGSLLHPRIEVHGFGDVGDIYGAHIRIKLLEFLRPEKKFESIDTLKDQIAKDVTEAKSCLIHL